MKYVIAFSIFIFLVSCNFSHKEKNYLGYDIELFDDTPVKEVSGAVKKENVVKIKSFFQGNFGLIDTQEPKFGFTLLMWAVFNHKYESAKVLLELGADPNIVSYQGKSPLIEAADFGKLPMMKLLVEFGANPHYAMDSLPPGTALNASIKGFSPEEDFEKVKYLVEELGVNIDDKNLQSGTPLYLSIVSKSFEITEYLINKGADINAPLYQLLNGKKVYVLEKLEKMEVEDKFQERKEKLIEYVRLRIDTLVTVSL